MNLKESDKFILVFFVGFIVVGIITTVIHEAAHYIAALSLGVPSKEIIVDPWIHGYGPGIILPENSLDVEQLRIFHYAGGLSAGIMALCFYCYLTWRHYRNTSQFVYGISSAVVVWMTINFIWGYYEGGNFNAYVSYAYLKQLFIALVLVFILHIILFRWIKKRNIGDVH